MAQLLSLVRRVPSASIPSSLNMTLVELVHLRTGTVDESEVRTVILLHPSPSSRKDYLAGITGRICKARKGTRTFQAARWHCYLSKRVNRYL